METVTLILDRAALRRARKKAKLTPRELGLRVGIGATAITNLENGWQNTTPERLAAIAKVLNIKLEPLFLEENSNNTTKPLDK
jgi:transcriptional regulator with XRE-family HTH domain